jgi:type I restriction enzyme R subunit
MCKMVFANTKTTETPKKNVFVCSLYGSLCSRHRTSVYVFELKGKASSFIPFNKGLNDGKATPPFGAGNPVNPNGLKTHYLWEEVLSKDSLANIIDKFASVIEETDEDTGKKKKKMIFPRYHQLTSVKQILAHAKENGIGQKYFIQHSAGSGKSKSIAWLSHQLHGLFDKTGTTNLFDSVIVITDRTVLDKQLSEEIKQFSPNDGHCCRYYKRWRK